MSKERPADIGAVREGWPSAEAGNGDNAKQLPWQEIGSGDLLNVPRRESYDFLSANSSGTDVAIIGERWATPSGLSSVCTESRLASKDADLGNFDANPAAPQLQAAEYTGSDVRHLIAAGWVPKGVAQDDLDAKTARLVENMSGADALTEHWVERDRLVSYLSQRVFRREQCRQLPLSLCFFVVLVLLMTLHLDLHTMQQLSGAIEQSMALEEPAPTGFTAVWEQAGRRAEAAMAVPHTRVLGGVRVARLLEGKVEPSEVLCNYDIGSFVWDAVRSDGPSRPSTCNNRSSELAWIHWPLQRDAAQLALTQTRSRWGAASTAGSLAAQYAGPSGLAVQSISVNDKVHAYTLYSHSVHFDLSGFMINETRAYSFDARPPWLDTSEEKSMLLVLDVIFCLLLAIFPCLALIGCCMDCKAQGCRATMNSCCTAGLIVGLLMFCMGLMTVTSFLYCNFLTAGLNTLVSELPVLDVQKRYSQLGLESYLVANSTVTGTPAYEQQLNAVVEQAQRVQHAQVDLQWYTAVVMICACLRLLRALHASSRLNFLMGRVWRAAEDLTHLLLMLCTALMVFLLTGHLIFGGRIEVFSSGTLALESTVLFLFGFMFDAVHKSVETFGGGLGIAWVCCFNIFLVLGMLNVALVLVLHAYVGEEAKIPGFGSLYQDVMGLIDDHAAEELCDVGPNQFQDYRAAAEAVDKYSEKRVCQALQRQGAGIGPWVSSASLAVKLGARPGVEWQRIDRLVTHAAGDVSPSLLTGSLRLCSRLDTNVRELGSHVAALAVAGDVSEASGLKASVVEWQPLLFETAMLDDLSSRQPPEPPQPPQALAVAITDRVNRICSNCGSPIVDDEVYCRNCLVRHTEALQVEDLEPSVGGDLGASIVHLPPDQRGHPYPPEQLEPSSLVPFAPSDLEVDQVLALGPIQAETAAHRRSFGSEDEDEIIAALALPDDVEPPVISKMVWTRTLPLVTAIDALAERHFRDDNEIIYNLERNLDPVLRQAYADPRPDEIPSKLAAQEGAVEDSIEHLEDVLNKFTKAL